MRTRSHIKRIVEGELLAEVEVVISDDDPPGSGWGPYYGIEDARKLDAVRVALRQGNVDEASKYARIFRLVPLT